MRISWSRLLALELLLVGAALAATALLAHRIGLDPASGWGPTRRLTLATGAALLLPGAVLSLPRAQAGLRAEAIERALRYAHRAAGWCLLAVLGVELVMRVIGFTPVIWTVQTNWFGTVQADGTLSFLGDEGFAFTHYRALGEVATPFDTGANIIVLGDSRTEARQVPDAQKYSSVAETLLRKRGLDVNVRNFGRSALDIATYVTHIPLYRELYHPALFVVQITEDDLTTSFNPRHAHYFEVNPDQSISLVHRRDISGPLAVSEERTLHLRPVLVDYAVERINLMFPAAAASGSPLTLPDGVLDEEIAMILQAAGDTPVIFVLIPNGPVINDGKLVLTPPGYADFVARMQASGAAVVVDTLPRFQDLVRAGYFPVGFFNSSIPYRGHLNRYGHQVTGELLADAIADYLR